MDKYLILVVNLVEYCNLPKLQLKETEYRQMSNRHAKQGLQEIVFRLLIMLLKFYLCIWSLTRQGNTNVTQNYLVHALP